MHAYRELDYLKKSLRFFGCNGFFFSEKHTKCVCLRKRIHCENKELSRKVCLECYKAIKSSCRLKYKRKSLFRAFFFFTSTTVVVSRSRKNLFIYFPRDSKNIVVPANIKFILNVAMKKFHHCYSCNPISLKLCRNFTQIKLSPPPPSRTKLLHV